MATAKDLTTHLSALYKMVREAAGPDLVVLVKRALQKFVWVKFSFFIYKVWEEQINTSHTLIFSKTEDNVRSQHCGRSSIVLPVSFAVVLF